MRMKHQFETGNLVAPVQKRLLSPQGESTLLEKLINEAGLSEYLLDVTRYESAVFYLSTQDIKPLHPSRIDRLSMVRPVSFEFLFTFYAAEVVFFSIVRDFVFGCFFV